MVSKKYGVTEGKKAINDLKARRGARRTIFEVIYSGSLLFFSGGLGYVTLL